MSAAAAAWPRDDAAAERLLWIDPERRRLRDAHLDDMPALLRPGDLLVVNDAATLPASLSGRTAAGSSLEVRLYGQRAGPGPRFRAVLFGPGDWRLRTEDRPEPARLAPGDRISFAPDLSARVEAVADLSPRLVELTFDRDGAPLWSALYRYGRPVQYSYVAAPLELWSVQTHFGARPWAAEMPSAGRPLRWHILRALGERGVRMAALTHAAGLSSTGDPVLDAALPLPEQFDVPEPTVRAIRATRAAGGRVVAVGTTVVRALEGSAVQHRGELVPGPGETDLVIRPGFRPQVVHGILTGIHEPGSSHFGLLHEFAPGDLLAAASTHARAAGYLGHEFGDSCLVLSGPGSTEAPP